MSPKVIVEKQPDGPWSVSSTAALKCGTMTFDSKVDAVTYARSHFPPETLIIKTAAGQIIRPARLTPSQPAAEMTQAILDVVRARTQSEAGRTVFKDTQEKGAGKSARAEQVNKKN